MLISKKPRRLKFLPLEPSVGHFLIFSPIIFHLIKTCIRSTLLGFFIVKSHDVPFCICPDYSEDWIATRECTLHWFKKQKKKHSSTLISLTWHIYSIPGDKPQKGFWTTGSGFITHLFPPFAGPFSVLWPFRKLLLPPVGISLFGNCAKAVCITTLSRWTDISCYNYANSRLGLYFSLWLCADMHEQKGALAVYSNA